MSIARGPSERTATERVDRPCQQLVRSRGGGLVDLVISFQGGARARGGRGGWCDNLMADAS